jgi:hypothetical protein
MTVNPAGIQFLDTTINHAPMFILITLIVITITVILTYLYEKYLCYKNKRVPK